MWLYVASYHKHQIKKLSNCKLSIDSNWLWREAVYSETPNSRHAGRESYISICHSLGSSAGFTSSDSEEWEERSKPTMGRWEPGSCISCGLVNGESCTVTTCEPTSDGAGRKDWNPLATETAETADSGLSFLRGGMSPVVCLLFALFCYFTFTYKAS